MKALVNDDNNISIYDVRHMSDIELQAYKPEYRSMMYLGVKLQDLSQLTWQDLPGRRADGCLPCSDSIWLLSDIELDYYIELNSDRQLAIETNEKARAEAEQKAIEDAIEIAKATGKPTEIDRYLVDCQSEGREDCSFDLCVVSVDGNGNMAKAYSHCF